MTTSHKTNWREARMKIQEEKEKMRLPDGRTCNHCAHIEHCKWLFGISGEETICDIYPSRFYDDVMTIYHRDGTKTEVVHPFDALQKCEEHTEHDPFTWRVGDPPEEGEFVEVNFGNGEYSVGIWYYDSLEDGTEYRQWECWNFADNAMRPVDEPPVSWRRLPS